MGTAARIVISGRSVESYSSGTNQRLNPYLYDSDSRGHDALLTHVAIVDDAS